MTVSRLRRTLLLGAAALCLLAALPPAAGAGPGDLDLGFGTDGWVLTDVSGNGGPFSDDMLNAVAAGNDGTIIAVGRCPTATGVDGEPFVFCVARYAADGSLDPSFGGDGVVTTHIRQNSTSRSSDGSTTVDTPNTVSSAAAVAVQSDGKIVVAGPCWGPGNFSDFCLARYTSSGALDPTFGPGCTTHSPDESALGCSPLFAEPGIVVTDVAGGGDGPANAMDNALAVAVQPDGGIVAAGMCQAGASPDFCLARYDSAGGLVGTAITDVGGYDVARAVTVQSDGRILVAGESDSRRFTVVRYNPDGSLDTAFGSGGMAVAAPLPGDVNFGYSLDVQADGKIVVAGWCGFTAGCLARFDANGSLDASFDGDGTLVLGSPGVSSFVSVALQGDGAIVAGGGCGAGELRDFCVTRFESDGSLDATFGTAGGAAATSPRPVSAVSAMAVAGDGGIVVAGICGNNYSELDFCLTRFLGDQVVPPFPWTGFAGGTFQGAPALNPAGSNAVQTFWFRLGGDFGLGVLVSALQRQIDCATLAPLGLFEPAATPNWDAFGYQAYTNRYYSPGRRPRPSRASAASSGSRSRTGRRTRPTCSSSPRERARSWGARETGRPGARRHRGRLLRDVLVLLPD